MRLLAPMGRLVVYGAHGIMPRSGKLIGALAAMIRYALLPRFSALRLANDNKSVMAFNLSCLFDEVALLDRVMCNLLTEFEQGRLVPPPTRCYPFEHAGLAHRDLQSGLTIGKCVLPGGPPVVGWFPPPLPPSIIHPTLVLLQLWNPMQPKTSVIFVMARTERTRFRSKLMRRRP